MKYKGYVGIDVSKNTLDAVCIEKGKRKGVHLRVSNDTKGFKELFNWLNKTLKHKGDELLFCMEHTGIYTYKIASFLSENKIDFSLENPLQIKRSMGITRIKNDKADASLIAKYAMRHLDSITLYKLPLHVITKLKHLIAYRDRLIKSKRAMKVAANELTKYSEKENCSFISSETDDLLKVLEKKVKKVDAEIIDTINSKKELKKNYDLILSVGGVGPAVAMNVIACTNNFTSFQNARQFACYSGIAPFEHTSGTSLKGRTRISNLANKKMKSLIGIGACSAIQHDPELKKYYHRRVAEGKNPLSTINIIRNKIVSRMFAVVKRGTPFVKMTTHY